VEAVLWLTKPRMEYAQFRQDLFGFLDTMAGAVGPVRTSLWQRKLGLGAGEEFVLRISDEGGERIAEAIQWIGTSKANAALHASLVTHGSLALVERVA